MSSIKLKINDRDVTEITGAGCCRYPLRFTKKCSHFLERLTLRKIFLLRVRKPLRRNPTRLPGIYS